ncbi:hypothetical protein F5Y05DRAFT_374979 [Hypoxylon sp. FL0543]|nr:hypothetical protein F5Y05DRAFT_374979 [Hypoxylon sp. FL0543]
MSSKELLGDLIVTLVKKVRRSFGSKSEKSDQYTSQGAATAGDRTRYTSQCTSSHSSSYGTVTGDGELLPTEAAIGPSRELEVTHLLDLATSSFPPIPLDAVLPPLPKPVLVPRTSPGPQIPFARAWASELADHEISQKDLVAFIDSLNIIIRPHPAVYVVKLAALAVGCIPYDGADGIAGALEAVAELATIAIAHTRSKKYIGLMNEEYFHPRKLHAKVVSSKRVVNMFNLDKKDSMLVPLSEDTLDLSLQERCLKHLSKRICELSFDDIPPPRYKLNMLARMAAWEVRHKIAKADKKAKRRRERAWKRHLKGKERKESRLERRRVKSLDWILIQNLGEWEAARAKKQATRVRKWHLSW